jgi:methylaspartate mutase epsilon subunit
MPEVSAGRWEQDALASARAELLGDGTGPPLGAALGQPDPSARRADRVLADASALGRPLIEAHYPQSSVGIDGAVLRELCDAGADQLLVRVDDGPAASPLVRQLIDNLPVPVGIRTGSSDPRMLVDASFAAGASYYAMSLFDRVGTVADPEVAISQTQYVDRLAAYYADNGACVVRECTASSGGSLVPPAISLAFTLIDAALAGGQGVQDLVLTYNVMGNLIQDVVALRALRRMSQQILGDLGSDRRLYVAACQWYTSLPHDKGQAYGLALAGTALASLGEADVIVAAPAPDLAGGPGSSIRAARQMLNLLTGQSVAETDDVLVQVDQLCAAVAAIIDHVRAAGDGDLAQGTAALVRQGLLHDLRGGSEVGRRDDHGAVQWARSPMVTLPAEAMAYQPTALAVP